LAFFVDTSILRSDISISYFLFSRESWKGWQSISDCKIQNIERYTIIRPEKTIFVRKPAPFFFIGRITPTMERAERGDVAHWTSTAAH
jgi:hypothetical protein